MRIKPQLIDEFYSRFAFRTLTVEERELLADSLPNFVSTDRIRAVKALIMILNKPEFVGSLEAERRDLSLLRSLVLEHDSPEFIQWIHLFEARFYAAESKLEEAIFSYRKVITAPEPETISVRAYAYYLLATLYYNFGANDEATEHFQTAAQFAQEHKHTLIQAYAFSQLSEIYLTNGQNQQALELNREALVISRTETDASGPLLFRLRECTILIELGEVDEVLQRLGPLIEELNRTRSNNHLVSVEVILGRAYLLKKEYEHSREHFDRAISLCRQYSHAVFEANARLLKVELLVETKEYEEAYNEMREAEFLCSRMPNSYQILGTIETRVALESAQGHYEAALAAFREFYDAKQKLLSQEAERRMAILRIEHHVQQKEKEAEVYRLKSEQLEKELMNKTGHLVKQAEMLSRFRDDMRHIISETTDPANGLRKVREKIRELSGATMDWEEYDKTFAAVHPDFKQHLVSRFPALTPMETKVCTLLRIELTSKEIANLLNISERSVENHRYRARKKFGLGESENMNHFLSSL